MIFGSIGRPNNVSLVTVTNHKAGALKITKKVTVNDEEVTNHSVASLADGTYTFTILDSNDQPAKGKVNGTDITNGQVTITVTNGQAASVLVTDMIPGAYTVTETAPTNSTSLTKVVVSEGSGNNVTDKAAMLTVEAGKTAENEECPPRPLSTMPSSSPAQRPGTPTLCIRSATRR